MTGLNADEVLSQLPKVDLHVHLLGTVRPDTFGELARRQGLKLPDSPQAIFASINSKPPDPELYRNTRIPMPQGPSPDEPEVSYSLFQASDWVRQLVNTEEDLARIAYEACADSYNNSGTRHLEFSFDMLPEHLGMTYAAYVEAMAAGIREAEAEFGISARMLAAIDRSGSGEQALEWIRTVTDHPHDYVVGIGLDNLENSGPPERFADAYALARSAGLGRTAHTSEHVPTAQNAITCLDLLDCDRLDHGYFVLEDDEVVARMRYEQVPFTVISTTSRRSWRPWRRASIAAMLEAGLNLIPASDDPGMFPTTLLNEYRIQHEMIGTSIEKLCQMSLAGVDACWLPAPEKAELRRSFETEINELLGKLQSG